jgi:hypothetical protein
MEYRMIYLGQGFMWAGMSGVQQSCLFVTVDVLEHCAWMSELRRKYPGDIVKLATTNGIPYQTFVHRIKKGWSYELASTLPPSPSNSAMILKQKYGEDYHRNSNEMGVRQNKEVEKRADLLCFVNPDPEINFKQYKQE